MEMELGKVTDGAIADLLVDVVGGGVCQVGEEGAELLAFIQNELAEGSDAGAGIMV